MNHSIKNSVSDSVLIQKVESTQTITEYANNLNVCLDRIKNLVDVLDGRLYGNYAKPCATEPEPISIESILSNMYSKACGIHITLEAMFEKMGE